MRNKRLSRVFQRRSVTTRNNTSSRRKFFGRRGHASKQSSKSNSLISPSYYDDNSYLHDYPDKNVNKEFVERLENDLEYRFAREMFSKKKERSNSMPVSFVLIVVISMRSPSFHHIWSTAHFTHFIHILLLQVCLPVQFERKEHLKNLTAVLQKDEVSWWEESSGPGDTYDSNCTRSTISSAGSFLGGLIICTEIVTCGDGY